jgi:hypothetical protein
MSSTLHLSHETSSPLVFEVIFALTGVKVTAATVERAKDFREALGQAVREGLENKPTAVRFLTTRGFPGLPRHLPEGETAREFILRYMRENFPDVVAYEDYRRTGLCEFKADDYTKAHELDFDPGAGATSEVRHVREIISRHPIASKIPAEVTMRIPGVYWQSRG